MKERKPKNMLKLEKSKNKKRLCCWLKVYTICINLQKMETLCQHSPLNKDTNIQTTTKDSFFHFIHRPNRASREKEVFYCATPSKPINTSFLSNTNQSNLECFSDDKLKDSRAFQQKRTKSSRAPHPHPKGSQASQDGGL